jgi:hypothetical protein
MLILPRNIQASCLLRRGMPTIFLHLGKFQPAKVGNFQPAETGEYSTGVDTELVRMVSTEGRCRLQVVTARGVVSACWRP